VFFAFASCKHCCLQKVFRTRLVLLLIHVDFGGVEGELSSLLLGSHAVKVVLSACVPDKNDCPTASHYTRLPQAVRTFPSCTQPPTMQVWSIVVTVELLGVVGADKQKSWSHETFLVACRLRAWAAVLIYYLSANSGASLVFSQRALGCFKAVHRAGLSLE
jgi:hypothetical protein